MKVRRVKSFNLFGGSPAPCGGRALAGAPAPLTALQASPALLRARAPAACSRCPRFARANLGLRPPYGLPTVGLRSAYGLAGSTTFRPNICQAFAGVFRFNRRVAVQLP